MISWNVVIFLFMSSYEVYAFVSIFVLVSVFLFVFVVNVFVSLMLFMNVLVSTPTFLARVHVFLYWFFVYKQHGICGIWQILLLLSMSKCYWSLNVISKWFAMVKTEFGCMLIRIHDSMKLNIVGLWYNNLNYERLFDVKLFESQNNIVNWCDCVEWNSIQHHY